MQVFVTMLVVQATIIGAAWLINKRIEQSEAKIMARIEKFRAYVGQLEDEVAQLRAFYEEPIDELHS